MPQVDPPASPTLDDKPRLVFHLFAGTGATYDEMVERATRGMDSHWKRLMLRELDEPHRVLDLACGTGMLSFMILEAWPRSVVHGVDLQEEYLTIARRRAAERGLTDRFHTTCSPAEDLDYGAGCYDTIVTSYLPKYADLARLVPKLSRALEPGGRLVFHDFTYPTAPAVRTAWEESFAQLAEEAAVGNSAWVRMYRGLPEVIRSSRWVSELEEHLAAAGFTEIRSRRVSVGCAAIVRANKPR